MLLWHINIQIFFVIKTEILSCTMYIIVYYLYIYIISEKGDSPKKLILYGETSSNILPK